jgi:hypothetical protein
MPNLLGKIASWLGRRPQPPPLDAPANPFEGMSIDEVKTMLAAALRGSFDEGAAAEKARVEAILTAPEAAMFTDLAADLVRGPATSDQAIKVLGRAENDAAKRAALLKSSPLESANAPTIH